MSLEQPFSANCVFYHSCESMAELTDGSVQTCVTSPPYYGLRDYGIEGQIGLEETPRRYIERLLAVFAEVKRVLRDDGTVWVVIGDSYCASPKGNLNGQDPVGVDKRAIGLKPKDLIGIPWLFGFAMRDELGFYLRQEIIWAKPACMPESVTDRCTRSHETIFMFAKSQSYFYDADAIKEPLAESSIGRYALAAGRERERERERDYKSGQGRVQSRGGGPDHLLVYPKNYKHNDARMTSQESANRVWTDAESLERQAEVGANKRDVWTIATEPYAEAHFAVFPRALPSLCIRAGSSEAGCCASCGAPRTRQIELVGGRTSGRTPERLAVANKIGKPRGASYGSGLAQDDIAAHRTTGFHPSCECDAGTVPCLVLDPFAGSGTTLEVAESLGRRWVGYELNDNYRPLIEARTKQIGLLGEAVS